MVELAGLILKSHGHFYIRLKTPGKELWMAIIYYLFIMITHNNIFEFGVLTFLGGMGLLIFTHL